MPFAKFQRWPICWWVAVVVDHASRLVVGVAIFKRRPTSRDVYSFLGMAIRRGGSKPKYIITDKGKEFFCKAFKEWCRRKGIRPRYGAVGEHGSIAIIERFIRSLKSECTRRISVPFRLDQMRDEVACYATWYNQHRPHTALGGRTPLEVYGSSSPAMTDHGRNPKAAEEERMRSSMAARASRAGGGSISASTKPGRSSPRS